MNLALPLLMALAAQGRGGAHVDADIDAVTPGPAAGETPGPRLPHVTVMAARAQLMLGTDTEVVLNVDVSGFPTGATPTLRVLTNVGSVEPPAPGPTPGRFS